MDRGWQLTTKDADAIEDGLSKDNYLRGKLTSAPTKEKDPRTVLQAVRGRCCRWKKTNLRRWNLCETIFILDAETGGRL